MDARIPFAVAVLAIAVAAAGCGGSESAPLTKAEFIEQGNSVCKQGKKEMAAALKGVSKGSAQGSGKSSGEAELERVVTEVALPPVQGMTEELGDLSPPEKDQKQIAAIVAAFEEGLKKSKADPSSALTGTPFTSANERAEAYGLTECMI
jgi:hypothetical protein